MVSVVRRFCLLYKEDFTICDESLKRLPDGEKRRAPSNFLHSAVNAALSGVSRKHEPPQTEGVKELEGKVDVSFLCSNAAAD